ncbi:hypothetical protein F4561_002236 [Lipingzhangella halophila]|uniref:Uncharacterized protein n=1 Tax=Lipingzhangella halophila TaxID=1783352 RepID=A0A7W7RG84_9ACTN|nr:hypothetical protein [Lipingzhangella halophila]
MNSIAAHSETQKAPRRYPVAFASAFAPDGRRRRWGIAYRCPHCHRHHFGLSWTPQVGGIRRSGCGRRIWVVISRRYPADALQPHTVNTQANEVNR